MNPTFFKHIENVLHTERIDAYRQDGADHTVTLSRYLLNMALSESLYPALQFAEIDRSSASPIISTMGKNDGPAGHERPFP